MTIPPPGNVHLDEAIEQARAVLEGVLENGALRKAVLVNDLFGRIRVAVWPAHEDPELTASLATRLSTACKALWSGPIWIASAENAPAFEHDGLADAAWSGGGPRTARIGSGSTIVIAAVRRGSWRRALPPSRHRPL